MSVSIFNILRKYVKDWIINSKTPEVTFGGFAVPDKQYQDSVSVIELMHARKYATGFSLAAEHRKSQS